MICPLDRELREANKTSSTYHYLRRFQQMLLLSPVQTEATCLANNSQHFWMLYVASVCTSRCILMRVVGICCAKFETGQTFSYVQTHATTYNIVGSTMHMTASSLTLAQPLGLAISRGAKFVWSRVPSEIRSPSV